ncbi:hypothetical protein [Mycolicibacterium mengxianglii]|uniref:hypothetical protein n=1 Tax=Mycolicibacterium mengxianglii TaxID=2736649 RepID=UPI0018D1244E|nr:hypothetical protein [Mycolicibacterium mengxianglii]
MNTDTPAPPIETATDPVHCPEDLRQRWLALMSPLGFGGHTLWMAFLGADRVLHKVLTPLPARTRRDRQLIADVVAQLPELLAGEPGTTVAFLLARPGGGAVTDTDRRWAALLTDTAAANGVPLEPFFRAHDESLVHVEPAVS